MDKRQALEYCVILNDRLYFGCREWYIKQLSVGKIGFTTRDNKNFRLGKKLCF